MSQFILKETIKKAVNAKDLNKVRELIDNQKGLYVDPREQHQRYKHFKFFTYEIAKILDEQKAEKKDIVFFTEYLDQNIFGGPFARFIIHCKLLHLLDISIQNKWHSGERYNGSKGPETLTALGKLLKYAKLEKEIELKFAKYILPSYSQKFEALEHNLGQKKYWEKFRIEQAKHKLMDVLKIIAESYNIELFRFIKKNIQITHVDGKPFSDSLQKIKELLDQTIQNQQDTSQKVASAEENEKDTDNDPAPADDSASSAALLETTDTFDTAEMG